MGIISMVMGIIPIMAGKIIMIVWTLLLIDGRLIG
jgi:hypothetical protein